MYTSTVSYLPNGLSVITVVLHYEKLIYKHIDRFSCRMYTFVTI